MFLRLVTAAAVLTSAAVHLYLWFDVFSGEPVVGPAFLANAAAGLVIAVLLVRRRNWLPGFLALGFGGTTMGAFVVAATVGLFGVHEHWTGWPVWTAAVSEVVAIVGGALLLSRTAPTLSRRQLQHPFAARRAHLH
ncbi:MAG: hypothetical protein ABIQ59_02885 [Nocardioidaceae bacterium]